MRGLKGTEPLCIHGVSQLFGDKKGKSAVIHPHLLCDTEMTALLLFPVQHSKDKHVEKLWRIREELGAWTGSRGVTDGVYVQPLVLLQSGKSY